MTREEVILKALSQAPGQAAGIRDLTLRANRIMQQEGERDLTVHTVQDMLQSMRVARKPLVDVNDESIWRLTRDGKRAVK